MSKIVTCLILIWLCVLTGFTCYVIKAEHSFLKFADFVLDDNLKNVVQSGGQTFYVIDMAKVTSSDLVPVWSPVYVDSKDMGKFTQLKRKQTMLIKELEELGPMMQKVSPEADRFMKMKIAELESRKHTK
jgi:hypothetical protein